MGSAKQTPDIFLTKAAGQTFLYPSNQGENS